MKMKSPFATQGKNTHFSGTLLRHLGMYCQKPYIRTPHKAALRSRKYQYVYRFYARMGISK